MLISLITSFAFAFAPSSSNLIGIEPNPLRTFNPTIQQQLRHQKYWQQYLMEHPTWNGRFNEHTGLPYRIWGKGIPFSTNGAEELGNEVLAFVVKHKFVSLKQTPMSIDSVNHDVQTDRWYVDIDQQFVPETPLFNDTTNTQESIIPVWRRGVQARLQGSSLTMLGLDIWLPDNEQSIQSLSSISASLALDIAKSKVGESLFAWNQSVEAVVLPLMDTHIEHDKDLDARVCWMVQWETQQPRGQWVAFVDVETGVVWNVHNEVRFFDGSLFAEHDERTIGDPLIVSPLSELNIDGSDWRTDLDGVYSTDVESSSLTVTLEGRRTRVINQAGEEASFELTGGEQTWFSTEELLPELDQYVFQNHVYAWTVQWAPQISNNWTRSTVYVNEDDVCNAYFDGELHFYRAGSGCNNTGRIADVSYHEWGHGFHYYNLLAGEYDGAMSEGIADSIAFFQTEDNRIAPSFGTNGAHIRDVSPDYVYPDDVVNEVHQDGLIFGGSVWDWWTDLRADLGDEEAFNTVMPVFVGGLRGGPTLPTVFDEFIFADDDNEDLSDGTPNQCSLVEAFGRHGLGPNGGAGLLSLVHEPLGNQSSSSSLTLEANIEQFAEQCVSAEPEEAIVHFSWDGGLSWEESSISLTSNGIEGEIPKYADTGVVQYYIEMLDNEDNSVTVPADGGRHPFSLYVGELEEIFCTDFESDDGGFSHQLLAGENQEGADDWQWGTPAGMGGDPDTAASGRYVWGNDLGGEINGQQYNGEYQNGKHNQLASPEWDVASYDQVVLTFDRWLNVEDGYYDQAQITANGEAIWWNHSTSESIGDEHHQDRQWSHQSLMVDVTDTDTIQFAWEINSDRGLTMGGWNIDNVCVYGVTAVIESELDGEEEEKLFAGCSHTPQLSYWMLLSLGMVCFRRRSF